MRSLQVRPIARAPVSTVDDSARLGLLEYYLAHHEDLVRCAQASVDWLSRHVGTRRVACLAVDGEASQLVGLAASGLAAEEIESFTLSLSRSHDPLIQALTADRPVAVRGGTNANGPRLPIGSGFTVTPLGGGRAGDTDFEVEGLRRFDIG